MSTVAIVPLIMIGLFALLIIRVAQAIARVGGRAAASAPSQEEAQLLNDLARGLERMEQRIEAIETIVEKAPVSRQAQADRRTG